MVTPRKKNPSPARKSAAAPYGPRGPSSPDSMTPEVIEFITAVDAYKRKHQRPFPSWSEILDVVKALGYSRPA
jgi:hypothetical protein